MESFIESLHLECPHLFTGVNCTEPWEDVLKDAIDIASIAGMVVYGLLVIPTVVLGYDLFQQLRTRDEAQIDAYAFRLRKIAVFLLFIPLPFNILIFATGMTARYPLPDLLGVVSLVAVYVSVSCYISLLVTMVLLLTNFRDATSLSDEDSRLLRRGLIVMLCILFVSNLIPVIVLAIAGILVDPVFAYRWSFGTNGFAGFLLAGLIAKVSLPIIRSMKESIAMDNEFNASNETTEKLKILKSKFTRFAIQGVTSVSLGCGVCLFCSFTRALYNPYINFITMVGMWGLTFLAIHTAALIALYTKSWTRTSSSGAENDSKNESFSKLAQSSKLEGGEDTGNESYSI